jgi:outer membrane protein TolC
LAENDLENLKSQAPPETARLNALLGRPATDPAPRPAVLPPLRPLPLADADLIRLGSERSPELQALAREVAGRKEALDLARQAYIPDFGLSLSITGSVAQTLGGMLVLPTRLQAIRAGIEEARANLRAADAARVQYERNLAASFVLNLYALRNDERQIKLFQETIIPRGRQMIELAQTSYSTGKLPFADLVEAERELLNARLVTAQLLVERDKALLAIESWSAVDAEAMRPTTNK